MSLPQPKHEGRVVTGLGSLSFPHCIFQASLDIIRQGSILPLYLLLIPLSQRSKRKYLDGLRDNPQVRTLPLGPLGWAYLPFVVCWQSNLERVLFSLSLKGNRIEFKSSHTNLFINTFTYLYVLWISASPFSLEVSLRQLALSWGVGTSIPSNMYSITQEIRYSHSKS